MIIALTGKSNVGKSHIAKVLSELCDYGHLSFSNKLKEMYPRPADERNTFQAKNGTYHKSYKHYLASVANVWNVKDPHNFITPLTNQIYPYFNYVVDDLRTPLQLRYLQKKSEEMSQDLFVVRVVSASGFSVSWMDEFNLPYDWTIENNQLTNDQILQQFSQLFHTYLGA